MTRLFSSGPVLLLLIIFFLCLFTVTVVGKWKTFEKFGVEGWNSLIPVYDIYIMFKYTWDLTSFGNYLICFGIFFLFYLFGTVLTRFVSFPFSYTIGVVCFIIAGIAMFTLKMIQYLMYYHLSKSFKQNIEMFILFIICRPIGFIMLGFGDAKYHGIVGTGIQLPIFSNRKKKNDLNVILKNKLKQNKTNIRNHYQSLNEPKEQEDPESYQLPEYKRRRRSEKQKKTRKTR